MLSKSIFPDSRILGVHCNRMQSIQAAVAGKQNTQFRRRLGHGPVSGIHHFADDLAGVRRCMHPDALLFKSHAHPLQAAAWPGLDNNAIILR